MQKTSNYNLKKPEATDPLRVEDFNENADIIDAAILAAASSGKAVYGSVATTNSASRTIELGFKPKMVVLIGPYNGNLTTFGLLMDGVAIRVSKGSNYAQMEEISNDIQLNDAGIYIKNGYAFNWGSGNITRYLAIP